MALTTLIFACILALGIAQDDAKAVATTDAPAPAEEEAEMPTLPCVTPGFVCSDCKHQAVCIGDGEGGFKQIQNACPDGTHCVGNVCVAGAKCNYRPFSCSDEGFFPDPFDCTKYHVCVRKPDGTFQQMPLDCDGKGSYDATSGSCGFPLNSTACLEGPVPRCVEPLQVGVLKADPSLYYLCTEDDDTTGPELFKCAGGKLFDAKKLSCVAGKKSKK